MKIPRSFYVMLGEHKEAVYPSWFRLPNRILVLDCIQDPGNLGTLLTSSLAFKWDVVFLLPGCSDPSIRKHSEQLEELPFRSLLSMAIGSI
ncbi:hypothetical protein IEQ34_000738 [Dendrobium chrysotoxum]|uniref:tRNA/rRNA methyltransferase SpoU type domain-containing protein n=1 Tax=Dendrobium chrysotoxum TaxID=161865 RepID=A0AAV7H9V6_DENCH|nr:hypothetical protein IEQ34_000738 [Dendrobium chrysotoxum]